MSDQNIKQDVEAELQAASLARSNGLEGRARVCARRAAALALQGWAEKNGYARPTGNVMDTLSICHNLPELPVPVVGIIDHLLMRVSSDYTLPDGVDLLDETRQLIDLLWI